MARVYGGQSPRRAAPRLGSVKDPRGLLRRWAPLKDQGPFKGELGGWWGVVARWGTKRRPRVGGTAVTRPRAGRVPLRGTVVIWAPPGYNNRRALRAAPHRATMTRR